MCITREVAGKNDYQGVTGAGNPDILNRFLKNTIAALFSWKIHLEDTLKESVVVKLSSIHATKGVQENSVDVW